MVAVKAISTEVFMTSEALIKGDILIVDDILDNLRLLSAILTQQGYDVRSVTNGPTALRGAEAQPPDLILLDINMPEMSGYEVCQSLKKNPQTCEIPIIFLSALNEVVDKVRAFAVGGVDFITKPFQVEEVLVRIETQLSLRKLQAQLQSALEQERALNQRIEAMAALEERNRIARDIHDSLGHALVALNIQMETALTLWHDAPDRAYEFLVEAKQLGSEALDAVRQSVSEMRTDPLQGKLLGEAIATLTQEFQLSTGIQPQCQISLAHPLPQSVNIVIYRVIQEGLTNICKHAQATTVQLQVQTTPTIASLSLKDNGNGFYVHSNVSGFGLQGMRERVDALNGQLAIASEPGAGCWIQVSLPIGINH
jgi:signal transduction histidine kinase